MGKESGSILWPQSPGVARLLPAGKREFGEISAADVPDNTVKRQSQQGLCLPDEKVPPPPPTTGLHGAIPGVLPGPHQSEPVLRRPRVHLWGTSVFLTLPDWISWHSGQASGGRGHAPGVHTHSDTATCIKYSLSLSQAANSYPSCNTQLVYCRVPLRSPPRLPNFRAPPAP